MTKVSVLVDCRIVGTDHVLHSVDVTQVQIHLALFRVGYFIPPFLAGVGKPGRTCPSYLKFHLLTGRYVELTLNF